MATLCIAAAPGRTSLTPRWSNFLNSTAASATNHSLQQALRSAFPSLANYVPVVAGLRLPSLIRDIWDSVLRAVPKKKTSYMKKRSRFMAGKALKDVTALNKCPGCGNIKRSHYLCPYCVNEIKQMFKNRESKK